MADDKKPKEQQGLPEGWKWVRLGEVAKITTGNSNVQDASDDGVYPFFDRSGEIKRSERYFLDTEAVIVPGEGSDFFPKYFKGKFDLHQRTYAIFNFKGLDGMFLYYLMHLLRVNLIRTAVGTTVLSLRLPHFQNLELPLPPLPEQRKIAEILETVDNAIEKTEKIIEKYKRIKQGLMQDLLTKGIDEKGNIRSEKTHKFKDSPLGRIPEEWEVVRLGEVGEIISGSTPSTYNSEYWNGEIVWITPEDLSKIKTLFIENSSRKITQKGLRSCSARIIPAYSVVISSRAPIGYVKVSKVPFTTSQGCKSIAYNGKFSPEFLAIMLSNKVQDMINLGSGTTFQEITKSNLKKLLIPLPPLPEQKRIAEILSQIDQTIEKEERYKQKLERLKKGLMEDLLTGKVRVNKLLEGEVNEMA
jgi:type I restriction enzyme S subunit